MRIDTFCDLELAWNSCTLLGKILIFWLIVIGWIVLFCVSTFLSIVVDIGVEAKLIQGEIEED